MFKYQFSVVGIVAAMLLCVPAYTFAAGVSGAVTLTFDDANASQYRYVYPLLQAAGQKGVIYVPTGLVPQTDYISWNNLLYLQNQGWEIGGHTVTHAELPTLSLSSVKTEVNQCSADLMSHGLNAANFATPFGAYSPAVIAEIAKTYDSQRGFHDLGYNAWPYNKYFLHIKYVTNKTTLAEAKTWVDEALAGNHWLIISFHEVLPVVEPDDEYTWDTSTFTSFVAYINQKGVKTKTIKEVLSRSNILSNGSFELGFGNAQNPATQWTTDSIQNVTIDTQNNGAYPSPKNSLRIVGSMANSHVFGSKTPVVTNQLYGIRFFANTIGLTSGELGYYIDEYDAAGNWISGKWLGQANNQFVLDESYKYQPTSSAVASAALQIYLTSGSVGTAYVDGVEFFKP